MPIPGTKLLQGELDMLILKPSRSGGPLRAARRRRFQSHAST